MAVVKPDVVVISSDDDSDADGEGNFVTDAVKSDLILISSDDEEFDGERNLVEGFVSEQDAEFNELEDHELDKEEECIDNCNDGSGPSNKGGSDLHALSHNECKTYLLKHGMNVSGTKEECIQRIEERESLKDGGGESLYPRSSFSIDCTGDACRGDVVLFKQNLYNRELKIVGRRTVAGRIAKESYGATTQLHTFLVEVLWSKPFKQLDPLNVVVVKGCNLYRFGTFRQPWENEADRLRVLEEKHERGKAARLKRKWRETEFASGGNKGTKRIKLFDRVPSHKKHTHVNKNIATNSQAVVFQTEELTQVTCHPDPIQEASLPFTNDGTLLPGSGCSHQSSEQGPSQASQSPDHHDHNSKLPVDRSKDEKAKLHFPISSFSIDCTGDARERDIVLFKQRQGNNAEEKRTVTGRIVEVRQSGKKSSKHKFLIKVLWTIPFVENLQRSILLVRSRNLYKFGTFRQPWKNETMRSQMFEEKHKPASFNWKLKKTDIAFNKYKGVKRQKVSNNGPSSSKQPTQAKHKFSKKGTSVTPHKKISKMQKKFSKQTFQSNPKSNLGPISSIIFNLNQMSISSTAPNPNPISSTPLNPISSTTFNSSPASSSIPNPISSIASELNPISSTTSNLNPISSTASNPISSTAFNSSPASSSIPNPISSIASELNPISSTTSNLNPISSTTSNLNPISSTAPNLNPISSAASNPISSTTFNSSPASSSIPNPISSTTSNPNPISSTTSNPISSTTFNSTPASSSIPNPISSVTSELNPISSAASNPISSPHSNLNPNAHPNPNPNAHPNPNPNAHPNPNLKARQNRKPKARQKGKPNGPLNGSPNTRQNDQQNAGQNGKPNAHSDQNTLSTGKKNAGQSQNLSTRQNRKQKARQIRNPNALQSQNPNTSQSQNPNASQSQNQNTHQNKHQHQHPRHNRNSSTCQNRNLNACHIQDPSASHYQDPITSHNPYSNPSQNSNSLVYGGQQLHESLSSLSYDTSFMAYPPPIWFPPNQPPFPPGYGGQWGSNHVFIQPPDYNYVAAQFQYSPWYQQPL